MGCSTGPVSVMLKCALVIFNVVLALSGLVLVVVGALMRLLFNNAEDFVDRQMTGPPIAMIVIGVVIFLFALFGCCGALQESHCMLVTYAVVLSSLLIIELVLGLVLYLNRDNLAAASKATMMETLEKYTTDSNSRENMDTMQANFKCCGVTGPTDYLSVFPNGSLPESCCSGNLTEKCCSGNLTETCPQLVGDEQVYWQGCEPSLRQVLWLVVIALGGVALGLAAFEAVGIVCSLFLVQSIKNSRSRY